MRMLITVVLALLLVGCCSPRRTTCDPCPCPPVGRAATRVLPPPAPKNPALAAAERHGRGSSAIWSFLSASYDKDHDGRVVAAEYSRDPKTFQRLDQDADGALTAADFAGPTAMEDYLAEFVWRRLARFEDDSGPKDDLEGAEAPRPLDPAVLGRAFGRGDADHDGRLTEAELVTVIRAAEAAPTQAMQDLPKGVRVYPVLLAVQDGDSSGDLSLAEVEAWAVRATERSRRAVDDARAKAAKSDPTPPKEPRPSAAAMRRGPAVGDPAPAISLPTRDGGAEVSLASFAGKKPVALIFGSYTCPPFRFTAIRLRQIVDTYLEPVQFLFVYMREAHAVDGRAAMPSPDQPVVEEPTTLEERSAVANLCALDLGFHRFPTLVDGMDNAVARAYAAPPARLYVIGRDGKIVYKSEPGPFGLDPDAFEAALKQALEH